MSSAAITLHGLFGLDRAPVDGSHLEAVTSRDTYAELEARLKEKAGPTWSAIRRRIPEQLRALLDVDALGVLVGAWNKSRELRKYRDPARYPPDQVVVVPLMPHKIQSKHEPYVELLIDDQPVGRLHFQVELTLTLQGTELKIQGGRIMEIRTGQCQGVGTLKCEGAIVGQAERKLSLPGVIELKDGIAIPE